MGVMVAGLAGVRTTVEIAEHIGDLTDHCARVVGRGYAVRMVVFAGTVLAMTVEVVKRADDLVGFKVRPRRWVVERTFAWIGKHRRCVRDYETLPEHHETMVYISMIMTMPRRLARTGER